MKLIDEKGKLFGKINIIDIAILLIIIGVGFFAVEYFLPSKDKGAVNRKINYEIELLQSTREFADMVKLGDEIRESIKGDYLGKIVKTEIRPSSIITANTQEGRFIKTELPSMYDVIITLEADGLETEKSITAENQEIKVGKRVFVKGKGYAGSGYILAIHLDD
jgi:hypothetical protein